MTVELMEEDELPVSLFSADNLGLFSAAEIKVDSFMFCSQIPQKTLACLVCFMAKRTSMLKQMTVSVTFLQSHFKFGV